MSSTIRHYDITNTTGALIPSMSPTIVVNKGRDYGLLVVKRTFITAEIGPGAGKTQDTTSNPTTGFLFAQVLGANILNAFVFPPGKSFVAAHTTVFTAYNWSNGTFAGDNSNSASIAVRIVTPNSPTTTPGYLPNYSSIYILDGGTAAATEIGDGDSLSMILELGPVGSSSTNVSP